MTVAIVRLPRLLGMVVFMATWSCDRASLTNPSPTGPNAAPIAGLSCGVERWPVKTLSDADAQHVNVSQPIGTTITTLNSLTPHCSGLPDRRTFDEEFRVYEVVGRVTLVRLEDDRDYHIAVVDPAAPEQSIVTEVADPMCDGAIASPHSAVLANARGSFTSLIGGRPSSLVGQTVRIRGVGFFDFDHRQTGRSRSCIELHPILSIERISTS